MPELSPAVAQLYSAYVEQLGAALESLRPWWQKLEAAHPRAKLRLRWPAGIGSHPRVLAIYRDFHQRLTQLSPDRPGPTPAFDDDAAWGSEREAEPETLIPIPPERLLVDRLQVEAPALFTAMIPLVLTPLGHPPDPRPSLRALEVPESDPRPPDAYHFVHRHGVEHGVERLLAAGQDLRSGPPLRKLALAEASEFHRLAHHAYTQALALALAEAETWWADELGLLEARGADSDRALDELFLAYPCGVVSHPRVLGVVQAYWVLGEEVNTIFAGQDRQVGPEQLLLGWLLDGQHQTWVEVLSAMPYWPIGLDGAGRWV